ncbi:MAG: metallopeptidase TldD-related protein [Paracoccaceae bacterium]|nr:metallopeptidase TldD-related protein [Paracoccaceae bacterium]
MAENLANMAKALIKAAKGAGADAADALVVEGQSVSIDVRAGALEQAERAEGIDLGLRVLIGQRQAIVSFSDANPDLFEGMAERAVAMAREAPEDPYIGLAEPDQLAKDYDVDALEMFDPSAAPNPAELQDDAMRCEAAALAVNGISQVSGCGAGYGAQKVHLEMSNGFSGGYRRSSRSTSCVAITGSGTEMERDYAGESRIFQADLPSPEEIGALAAERTIARAGARKPKTGAYPVVYDERISSGLIGHLLGAVNGASVARGSSWLRDKLGEQVLPKGMSIIENPHRVRISGSKPFDGEGLATARRMVVEDGMLQGWTLDLASAKKLGMQSTANASRGTSSAPSPSIGNIELTAGSKSRAELLAEMGTGLLITSMIGSSINPTTGDYSRGASGFWVENGEIQYPVNECTVAGNLHEMLAGIEVANDGQTHLSRVVPSILVQGLILAGE